MESSAAESSPTSPPAEVVELPASLETGGSQENSELAPVVFVPFHSLPDCQKDLVAPSEILKLNHFNLVYYKPTRSDNNGYYEFINPDKPDQKLTLYQSGLRAVVKHLPLAVAAAKSLEVNPHLQNDSSTYEVGVINTFNGMSTRLVVNTFQGEIAIYLKLYSANEKGQVYPTRKSVQFSVRDDIALVAGFIKGKK